MLEKVLLLASFIVFAICGENNLPTFNPKKIIDCTDNKSADDICNIRLVIEPLTTMTYYNITDEFYGMPLWTKINVLMSYIHLKRFMCVCV